MAGKKPSEPIEWNYIMGPMSVAGFGDISLVNDPKYWGTAVMIDGKHNASDWKSCPLWAKTVTGPDPKFKFAGDFIKRHQNLAGEPFFFDIQPAPDGTIIQLGLKGDKENKLFLLVTDSTIEEIEPEDVAERVGA